jgi:DNA-binding Xre family transcriptional regulator
VTHLGRCIAAYQKWHDFENKQMAKEIGIPESSLTRIKQGKMPDARGLAKLLDWLLRDSR